MMMRRGTLYNFNFESAEDFADYVKHTLIPDFKSSGSLETAREFERVVRLIGTGGTDSTFIRHLRSRLIPDLIGEGQTETANDFSEAIYWIEDTAMDRVARIARRVVASYSSELRDLYDDALATGEDPYKANRDCVQIIDVFTDEEKGLRRISELVRGIDQFAGRIELIKTKADQIAKQSVSGFRR